MRDFIHTYWPHMAGGGTIGTLLILTFKDSWSRFFNSWLENRRLAHQATLAASGKDKDLSNAFISLLKSDLESQGRTREDMARSIGKLCETSAQLLEGQRAQGEKLDQMNRELLTLKGAVLGRF